MHMIVVGEVVKNCVFHVKVPDYFYSNFLNTKNNFIINFTELTKLILHSTIYVNIYSMDR